MHCLFSLVSWYLHWLHVDKDIDSIVTACLNGLQDLPKTIPVTIKLPSELFGDMMMVLEFLNVFGNLFDIKDEFPSGLTFGKPIHNHWVFGQPDKLGGTVI